MFNAAVFQAASNSCTKRSTTFCQIELPNWKFVHIFRRYLLSFSCAKIHRISPPLQASTSFFTVTEPNVRPEMFHMVFHNCWKLRFWSWMYHKEEADESFPKMSCLLNQRPCLLHLLAPTYFFSCLHTKIDFRVDVSPISKARHFRCSRMNYMKVRFQRAKYLAFTWFKSQVRDSIE